MHVWPTVMCVVVPQPTETWGSRGTLGVEFQNGTLRLQDCNEVPRYRSSAFKRVWTCTQDKHRFLPRAWSANGKKFTFLCCA